MTTLLLLITEPIPNPVFEDTKNYLNRILFHINPDGRKCQTINLRNIIDVLRYRKQKFECFKNCHDEGIEKLNFDLGEELTNVILDGKCNLIILVDSPGGYNGYASSIIDFILNLRSNGGETISFSFHSTASAAFMIVSAIEKRYSLLESEFMFHKGSIPETPDVDGFASITENEIDEELEKDFLDDNFNEDELQNELDIQVMEETYDRFFSNCDDEFRDECNSLQEQSIENIEYDAYFSGEHFLSLGVLEDCALSSEELIDWVLNDLGIIPKEDTKLDRILKGLKASADQAIKTGLFNSCGKSVFEDSVSPIFKNSITGERL